jgi:hypothetical protein
MTEKLVIGYARRDMCCDRSACKRRTHQNFALPGGYHSGMSELETI